MRPRTLRITAFGPYRDTLDLDFDDLGDHGLFLLHGPTGAGKTTLLDAMCFALYGEASGGEREMRELRSDHAPDTAVACVEFEFTLGEARYRVERVPTQLRPGKKTAQQHAATLSHLTADGVLHLADGVRDVEQRVQELLGLTSAQFRQVVVLPQGQFRALLTASSQERELILRALFDTSAFQLLEERLKVRAAEAARQTDACDRDLSARLGLHNAASVYELGETVKAQQETLRVAQSCLTEARAQRRSSQTARDLALTDDQLFRTLDLARERQAALEETTDQRAQRARHLQTARQADQVRPLYQQLLATQHSHEEAAAAWRDADDRARTAEDDLQTARSTLEAEEVRAPERERAAQRCRELRELRGSVEDYEGVRSNLNELLGEIGRVEARVKQCRKDLDGVPVTERETALKRAQQAALNLSQREAEFNELEQSVSGRIALDRASGDLEKARAAETQAHAAARTAEQSWHEARGVHVGVRGRFLSQQAGFLAEKLQEGAPCEVCGSTHHPNPATRPPDAPSQVDVEDAEKAEETAFKALKATEKKAVEAVSKREGLERTRADLLDKLGEAATLPLTTLQATLTQSAESVATCRAEAARIDAAEAAFRAAQEEQGRLSSSMEEARADLIRLNERQEGTQRQEQLLASRLPPEVRSSEALEGLLGDAEQTERALQEAYQTAFNRVAMCSSNAGETARVVTIRVETLDKLRNQATAQRQAFQDAATAAGLEDAEAVQAAFLEPHLLRELAQLVHEADLEVHEVQWALKRATDAVVGKVRPNVAAAEEAFTSAEGAHLEAVSGEASATAALKSLKEGLEVATQLEIDLYDLQQTSDRLRTLANAARGTTGQKISFHRYVLSAVLDEVLEIASQRLRDMSRDRYELRRADDEKGGLELAVLDHYTGRERSTKSLSGGESFQAALSLALGLADVVQQRSGGRHLETVFIDEGFGSLDPQALDLAMDCLIELQSNGRLVGVISHVQELQQHVQARLEVMASPDGSTARFVTV